MANYSLVLDTKFKPFSYDELIKSALMQTQAHQAIEEEYGNLSTKARIWDKLANEQQDPYAHRMYKNYSDDLDSRAEQLLREGLNPTSRSNMLDMKARYSSEIVPIETAYKRREALAEEQRKAELSNPTIRFQRKASLMSLDDFIKNPQLDYGKSYSGELLRQQVMQNASNYQRVLSETGSLSSIGLPFQYQKLIHKGASPQQIMEAMRISNDTDNLAKYENFLSRIVEEVLDSSGVKNWADEYTMKEFRSFANQGLYSALGTTEFKDYKDDYSANIALAEYKARKEREALEGQALASQGNLPINIDQLVSPNHTEESYKRDAVAVLKELGLTPGTNKIAGVTRLSGGTGIASNALRSNPVSSGDLVAKAGTPFTMWVRGKGGQTRLMTQEEFIKYNIGRIDTKKSSSKVNYKTQLNNAYSNIKQAVSQIGYTIDNNKFQIITPQSVREQVSNIAGNKGAYTMGAFRINLGSDSGSTLSTIIELTSKNSNGDTKIKKIKSFDKDGKITYGDAVNKADLMEDGKPKGKGAPIFYAHPNPNTEDLIMKLNGELYAIPKSVLGSLGNEIYNVDIPTLQEAVALKQQLIGQLGPSVYYNSKVGKQIENAIDNSGAGYLRSIINSFASSYQAPDYNITEKDDKNM